MWFTLQFTFVSLLRYTKFRVIYEKQSQKDMYSKQTINYKLLLEYDEEVF